MQPDMTIKKQPHFMAGKELQTHIPEDTGRVREHLPQETMQDRIVPPSHGFWKGSPRNRKHKIHKQVSRHSRQCGEKEEMDIL